MKFNFKYFVDFKKHRNKTSILWFLLKHAWNILILNDSWAILNLLFGGWKGGLDDIPVFDETLDIFGVKAPGVGAVVGLDAIGPTGVPAAKPQK